jgi:hypothetical protein
VLPPLLVPHTDPMTVKGAAAGRREERRLEKLER